MLDIPSQYIHYCVVVLCGNHCVIVYGLRIIVVTVDCYSLAQAQLKTRVNRGNRDIKYDQCI